MNRFVTALAGVALLSLAQPAQAADIFGNDSSMKDGPSYDSPYRGGRNWNSVYVGVGLDWLHNNYEIGVEDLFNFNGISGDGVEGTLIAGVQRQMGMIVVGLEGRVGFSDAKTELTIGPDSGSLDTDFSYAGYGKLGLAFANNQALFSVLGGYKCQHAETAGELSGYDDTLCGLSGGILLEAKLTENWVLGADVIYTKLDEVKFGIDTYDGYAHGQVDPSQWAAGLRLTYGF